MEDKSEKGQGAKKSWIIVVPSIEKSKGDVRDLVILKILRQSVFD